jgi:hypothetical protein
MIVSPGLIPNNSNGTGIVMQKILEVQKQIVMLNRHDREHIASAGDKAKPNTSCAYCKQQYEFENWDQISSRQQENKKRISTRNEIEREVEISDRNGCVIVPRTWAGKRVRITLVEDTQTT